MRRVLAIYREAFSGLPRDLWLLALVALVNRSGTMVLPFISLYLTSARGFAPHEAGELVALYGVGAAAGAYLGGFLADRFGAIRAQQASLFAGGASYLVLGSLTGRGPIAAALFASGAIVESFRPAVMAAYSERAAPEIKAKAFAFLRLAVNLGVGVGPAVGGFLALYGYRWLFYVDAGTCWLAALLLFRLAPEPSAAARRASLRDGARSAWRDGPFLALLVLVLFLASALFQVFSTFPLYLREHVGLRENGIGALLSLNAFLIVAFEMVLIHLVRNRDRMALVGAGGFALCAGFALMPLSSNVAWLALTVAIWTLGEMLSLPILNVVVSERASAGYQGQYMGLYTMAFSLAFVLAPLAGTAVYERFGAQSLWYGMGALGVALSASSSSLRVPLRARFRARDPATGEDPARGH